jgi:hypothetical protein
MRRRPDRSVKIGGGILRLSPDAPRGNFRRATEAGGPPEPIESTTMIASPFSFMDIFYPFIYLDSSLRGPGSPSNQAITGRRSESPHSMSVLASKSKHGGITGAT